MNNYELKKLWLALGFEPAFETSCSNEVKDLRFELNSQLIVRLSCAQVI